MKRLLTEASLIMKPEGQSDGLLPSVKPIDGSGDFTFTRGSNLAATRIDRAGLIVKGRENILLYSNDFSSTSWLKSQNVVLTSGQSGYDGTNDAWLFTKASDAYRNIRQGIAVSGVNTISFYAKAGTLDKVAIYGQGSTSTDSRFDLTNGTIISNSNSSVIPKITSVGNGWYRVEVFSPLTYTDIRLYLDWDQTTAGDCYIQDAQIEQGLAASPYIETTTTTAQAGVLENTPRLNYTTGVADPYLLLEPSRSNLFPNSEYFGSWQVFRGSLTANSITSPEGVVNAYRYEENADTGQHFIRFQSISMTSGQDYTASVFAKAGELTSITLGSNSASLWNPSTTTFNLSTGSVTSGGGTIEPMGNDWYRCIISSEGVTTTSSAGLEITTSSGAGSIGDGLYIYGAQIEAGSYPTSYIPTYSVSATRAADACIKTGISSLIGQTEGTLFIEFEADENIPQNMNLINFNNSTQASVLIAKRTSGALRAQVFAGGSAVVDISSTVVSGTTKAAFAYKSGDTVLYVNGVAVSNSNTFTFNGTLTEVIFPAHQAYFNYGHKYSVNQSMLFKTRLSNAELSTLTTI